MNTSSIPSSLLPAAGAGWSARLGDGGVFAAAVGDAEGMLGDLQGGEPDSLRRDIADLRQVSEGQLGALPAQPVEAGDDSSQLLEKEASFCAPSQPTAGYELVSL